ncbi:MAG: hypothetical protein H6R15_3933 [Proteobacteria bacterium]|nr:hypothetical protein [Pseudomonadota bacterium]
MENALFERRQELRHQQQQQPQQSALFPVRRGLAQLKVTPLSQRDAWQALAIAQARKQSGNL